MTNNTTNRKPHADTAGYVTERKSKHPKLPGHFVIIDRQNGGDWIDGDNRWVVIHANGDKFGCMVTLPSCKAARDVMYHVAGGGDDVDFGQHDPPASAQYEVLKDGARLILTVIDGKVTAAESPTHGCFDANFIGEPWDVVRKRFVNRGFAVHGGH